MIGKLQSDDPGTPSAASREYTLAPLLEPPAEVRAELRDLSAYFGAFVSYFVEETVRTGGSVTTATSGTGIDGILLARPAEKFGSIFARTREAADALYRARGPLWVFCEYLLEPTALPYPVYSIDLSGPEAEHRFAHPVRIATPSDLPSVLGVMHEVYGPIDERWFRAAPDPRERCLVAEIDGRVCGAAWVTVVGSQARLHTLSVVPRYRRLGVGSDLWHARILHARRTGAQRAITEIAETNLSSRAIATAGGMQRIGQVFEHRP